MQQKPPNLQSLLKLNAPEFSVQPKPNPPPPSDFAYPPPVDQAAPLSHQSSTYSEEGTMTQLMNLMSMFIDQGYTPPPAGPVMMPPPPPMGGPLSTNNYMIPPPPVPPPPPPPPPVGSTFEQQAINISPAETPQAIRNILQDDQEERKLKLVEQEEQPQKESQFNLNKEVFQPSQNVQFPPPPFYLQNGPFLGGDPSPGFNADFLFQPSLRKGSSTFSTEGGVGKSLKGRVYTVDKIMDMRKLYQGNKRLKIPIAKAEQFIGALHSQGGYQQFQELATYDSDSDDEKKVIVRKLQPPLMAYKPVERKKTKHKLRRQGVKSLNANVQALRVLLNKLSALNFAKISRQIVSEFEYSQQLLQELSVSLAVNPQKLVVQKGVYEPRFVQLYVRLLVYLQSNVQLTDAIAEMVSFAHNQTLKRLVLEKCQKTLQSEGSNEIRKEQALTLLTLDDSDDSDEQGGSSSAKKRMLGTASFLGQLFRQDLVSGKVIQECAKYLLERPKPWERGANAMKEIHLETLSRLFLQFGQHYFAHLKKGDLRKKFQKLPPGVFEGFIETAQNIRKEDSKREKPSLSSRVRFVIQDLSEKLESEWKPISDERMERVLEKETVLQKTLIAQKEPQPAQPSPQKEWGVPPSRGGWARGGPGRSQRFPPGP